MSKLMFVKNPINYVQGLCELSKLLLYVINKCPILNKSPQQFTPIDRASTQKSFSGRAVVAQKKKKRVSLLGF